MSFTATICFLKNWVLFGFVNCKQKSALKLKEQKDSKRRCSSIMNYVYVENDGEESYEEN